MKSETPKFRLNLEIGDNSKFQIFSNSNTFRESEIPMFSEFSNYYQEIPDSEFRANLEFYEFHFEIQMLPEIMRFQ